ncbi:MAG TPA: hypothetical protein VHQ91_14500 [Geminicoccaceae bacterium]|jgi:hypothetical protein|nr:hypothetical protein [Geminicoccaceae bacterium]
MRRTQGAARSGRQKEVLRPRTRAGLVEVDRLEALLIEAARARRSLTYAQVLAHFGIKITPRRVYALCRDLGQVCERNRARGEPELAVLVVRKSDRLPGEGFFHGAWRDGGYDGPATGPRARAYIDRLSALAFAFWAERVAGSAPAGAQSRR